MVRVDSMRCPQCGGRHIEVFLTEAWNCWTCGHSWKDRTEQGDA